MLRWISPLLVAALWVGCGGQPDQGPSDPAADLQATPEEVTPQPNQEALVILAQADAFDGKEDSIISKCLICSLGMAGTAEHTSKFGAYELHLCSETCKESFDAEPEKVILTATLPASIP